MTKWPEKHQGGGAPSQSSINCSVVSRPNLLQRADNIGAKLRAAKKVSSAEPSQLSTINIAYQDTHEFDMPNAD
ncbi:hypothetical protein EUGRSUZ_J01228 [Eucalyptus grandis]|uniref:Uncharacterized protein n=2 Tax=Eucalyptus grandis TaxID=71139 RepID=A0ACC3J4Z2_EUCGR|nr:hypothetical protein EUGRSUZ_J01228 [Eucalyptus grandis]